MTLGSTPTMVLHVSSKIDLTELKSIYITFEQRGTVLTKRNGEADVVVKSDTIHYVPYTDETRPKVEPSLDERVATVEDTTAELQEALSMILSGGGGGDGSVKPELKARILAYNKVAAERKEKAEDLDILVQQMLKLPPGQLKKVLTADVIAVLKKYGYDG